MTIDFTIKESNLKDLYYFIPSVSLDTRGDIWTSYLKEILDQYIPSNLEFKHDKFSSSKNSLFETNHDRLCLKKNRLFSNKDENDLFQTKICLKKLRMEGFFFLFFFSFYFLLST